WGPKRAPPLKHLPHGQAGHDYSFRVSPPRIRMRQPVMGPGTQPHVSIRVWIWLRKNAALYTIFVPLKQGDGGLHPPCQAGQPMLMQSHSRVSIKTPAEQEAMRLAGRLAADVLDMIGPRIAAGMTTGEIDRICHDYIVDVQKAIPAPLNY